MKTIATLTDTLGDETEVIVDDTRIVLKMQDSTLLDVNLTSEATADTAYQSFSLADAIDLRSALTKAIDAVVAELTTKGA